MKAKLGIIILLLACVFIRVVALVSVPADKEIECHKRWVLDAQTMANQIGIKFRWISTKEHKTQNRDLGKGFWISNKVISEKQFKEIMGDDVCRSFLSGTPCEANKPPEDRPIINACWYHSNSFCRKLSAIDGQQYRLPTRVELAIALEADEFKVDHRYTHLTCASSSGDLEITAKNVGKKGDIDFQGDSTLKAAIEHGIDYEYLKCSFIAVQEEKFVQRKDNGCVGINDLLCDCYFLSTDPTCGLHIRQLEYPFEQPLVADMSEMEEERILEEREVSSKEMRLKFVRDAHKCFRICVDH